MEVRHHLDHFWLIWTAIGIKEFMIDSNFSKGRIPFQNEVSCKTDGFKRSAHDILEIVAKYNEIYRALSVSGGYFDKFLEARGWSINYNDYGPPHNGARPKP